MATRNEIEHLLRNQIERIWGEGRVELVDETYAEDVVDHNPIPGQPAGREPMKQVLLDFWKGLPDTRMTLHRVLAQGEYGVDFWTMTATHTGPLFGSAPTGRAIRISGIDMARVHNGRVKDLWHFEEMFQMREQLKLSDATFGDAAHAVPPPAAPVWDGSDESGVDGALPDAPMTEREQRNLAVACRYCIEIWAKGIQDSVAELCAPNSADHSSAVGGSPINQHIPALAQLREAAPDLRLRVERYLVDGDYVASRWAMRGTHTEATLMGIAARGRGFDIAGMLVVKINDDGLISDLWHVEELDRLRAQIGA